MGSLSGLIPRISYIYDLITSFFPRVRGENLLHVPENLYNISCPQKQKTITPYKKPMDMWYTHLLNDRGRKFRRSLRGVKRGTNHIWNYRKINSGTARDECKIQYNDSIDDRQTMLIISIRKLLIYIWLKFRIDMKGDLAFISDLQNNTPFSSDKSLPQ